MGRWDPAPFKIPYMIRGYSRDNKKPGEIECFVQEYPCGCVRIFNADSSLRGWEPCQLHRPEDAQN